MFEVLIILWAAAGVCGLAYTFFAWKVWARLHKIEPSNIPYVEISNELTVLIPCRNEAEVLPHLLNDLKAQSYPVSIVVIDDGSNDDTSRIAKESGVQCIPTEGSGKKAALITGFKWVQTPWFATLDADVRLGSEWAQTMLSNAVHQKAECILGGVIIDASPSTAWNRFQQMEFAVMQAWIAGGVQSQNLAMGSGANILYATADYPVDALQPEWASGDDAFAMLALRKSDKTIGWCRAPEARVTTGTAPNWKALWQQRARWASKTGAQDSETQQTALTIAALHTLPLALAIGVIATGNTALLWSLVGVAAAKSFIDWRLLTLARREFSITWQTVDMLLFPIRYAILVWGAWWQLLLGRIHWKGRRI
ncbi:MAG TPA: hypothetical protein DD635_06715 [Flavobacteriales bacterium]|nr:hypothetical protein [Flavobacteriales bacterium]